MGIHAFEDVVGDTSTFFSEYFNKKPLLRQGALAGRLQDILSVRQLDDIVTMETVLPSYLRIAKDGKGVSPKAYTRTVTPQGAALAETVIPEKVYELFRSGGTITWNSLQHFLPSVRRLLDVLTDTFSARSEAVAFLTPALKNGYAPHHDPVDVFIFQVEGTKSWKLWNAPAVRRGDEATYSLEELGDPSIEMTLHPGDVLYIPHNTPHAAAAQEEISLHLSVIVEPRRWRDLVRETVADALADDDFHDFPHLGDEAAAALDLAAKLRSLQDRLHHIDPVSEIKRLTVSGRSSTSRPREFERLSAVDVFGTGTQLRRSTVPLDIGVSDGGKTVLSTGGHRLAVPDAVANVLRDLESGGSVTAAGFFPGVPEDRSLRAAQGLARLGVLEAADETRS